MSRCASPRAQTPPTKQQTAKVLSHCVCAPAPPHRLHPCQWRGSRAAPDPHQRTCCTSHAAASDVGLLPATSRGAADSSHAPRGFWPLIAQLERCARARRAPARRVRFGRSRTSEMPAVWPAAGTRHTHIHNNTCAQVGEHHGEGGYTRPTGAFNLTTALNNSTNQEDSGGATLETRKANDGEEGQSAAGKRAVVQGEEEPERRL